MSRTMLISANTEGLITVSIDGSHKTVLPRDADVQAETVYQSLDYHVGDYYEIEMDDAAEADSAPIEMYYTFMKSVISSVNKLADSANMPQGVLDGSLPVENVHGANGYHDEDVPF